MIERPGFEAACARVVSLAARDRPKEALEAAAEAESTADRESAVGLAALRALAHFIAADFDAAGLAAEAALLGGEGTADPRMRAFALSAGLLAGAGTPWAAGDRADEEARADELWRLRSSVLEHPRELASAAPGIMLFIEALFASGRVALAARALDEAFGAERWAADPLPATAHGHPLPSLPFLPLRVLLYSGRTAEAERLLALVLADAEQRGETLWAGLGLSMRALVAASTGRAADARRWGARAGAAFPRPRGYLQASARAIVGAALAIIGDLAEAEREVLAGGGPGLRRLQLVDRALGIEVLVSAALARDDLAAATRRARRLMPLTAHLASGQIAERVFAMIDLARGEAEPALRHADAALARAALSGARRETARSELVLARALVASGRTGEAAEQLQRLAATAAARGDQADQRAAARQLRALGRRVLPAKGSGWAGLTEREREIALIAARGYDNEAIGAALFLSPRTVQGAITRIMAAFDVTRRSALPARATADVGAPQGLPVLGASMRPALLTPRQAEVARCVAAGRSNTEIARELGISAKTVERHLADIFLAWEVRSRTAVAYLAAVGQGDVRPLSPRERD